MSFDFASAVKSHVSQLMDKHGETVTLRSYSETFNGDGYLSGSSYASSSVSVIFDGLEFDRLFNSPVGNFDLGRGRVYFDYETSPSLGDVLVRGDGSMWEIVSEEGEYRIKGVLVFHCFNVQRRQES